MACACLGIPLALARALLLAAGPTLAALNRPKPRTALAAAWETAVVAGLGWEREEEGEGVDGWLELRAMLLAGGVTTELTRDALHGLARLYDAPYYHTTDAVALRTAAAAAGCTHVVVAAARQALVGGEEELKVAAAGAVDVVLRGTAGNETRVSHGVHWYCRRERGLGFAPNDNIEKGDCGADGNCPDDTLRLSWRLNGSGGYRAGNVMVGLLPNIPHSHMWRKLVWGFHL
jgi:hypothetical protein